MRDITGLLNLIELEQIDKYLFRGDSWDIGSPAVFGGQVLAQALNAATRTVEGARFAHSLHAYFILPGNTTIPIIYEVDPIRDGRSFTTRRVVAIQNGRAIFNMSASFQLEQEGFDHQIEMLNVPPPESLASLQEIAAQYTDTWPDNLRRPNRTELPIEFKPVESINPFTVGKRPPYHHTWIRTKGAMPDDKASHQHVLLYASDFRLLSAALMPHAISPYNKKLRIASLDHAIWFHRDFRIDDWLLYAIESPSASNARGLSRGSIFTRDGKLIASVMQEGLLRVRKPKE